MIIKLNLISLKFYQSEVDAVFVNAILSGIQQRNLEVHLAFIHFLPLVSSTMNKLYLLSRKKSLGVYVYINIIFFAIFFVLDNIPHHFMSASMG